MKRVYMQESPLASPCTMRQISWLSPRSPPAGPCCRKCNSHYLEVAQKLQRNLRYQGVRHVGTIAMTHALLVLVVISAVAAGPAKALMKPKIRSLSPDERMGPKVVLEVEDRNDDEHPEFEPYQVDLFPASQHVPLNVTQRQLRPPPPHVPEQYDVFVGLSSFRDGVRCGYTLFTGFLRAAHPSRVFFGVVDQVATDDVRCVDAYCDLARARWPGEDGCKYRHQIRVDQRRAIDSRGPTLARHFQQQLIQHEEFCLQLDAHSVFTWHWDVFLVADWAAANNEMAILSTYIYDPDCAIITKNGQNTPPKDLPHLCQTMRSEGDSMVRIVAADFLVEPLQPQLAALWGAGFSFGKCHAEKRAPVDPHTLWLFDGEEFYRAASLWTHGYDMYSPTKTGTVVYHNYTAVPKRFEHVEVNEAAKRAETLAGLNRLRKRMGVPYEGPVHDEDWEKYAWGTARTFEEYVAFSGVDPAKLRDRQSCFQLHWVPFSNPAEVQAVVPGWTMFPAIHVPSSPTAPNVASLSPVLTSRNSIQAATWQPYTREPSTSRSVGATTHQPVFTDASTKWPSSTIAAMNLRKEQRVGHGDDSANGHATTASSAGLSSGRSALLVMAGLVVLLMLALYTKDGVWLRFRRLCRTTRMQKERRR
ncbi:hypothetical protein H310_04247 [Aphanomyces invadans]|uniref:Uncharacterized protein n=1 Tax=Aphanomyces invadans TaxID=157072 RepID=A0A024UG82_9STRA|nr:hypothetical protein H310_04247 [Aphanomyces invadans]ETW05294.1 hypothetical protein H310_04247 [Aphanomyces invadans]|eukprot:XP_008866732.1 hypothetical protein H310_04247 [Aphanomyces invadans]